MRFTDGGYSHRQYNPEALRSTAQRIAAVLPKLMEYTGAEAVAVTGKSGLSLAFATMMLVDFPLIVVRKRGENTHGSSIEGTPGKSITKYLILDDFIASGNTVHTIVDDLARYGLMGSDGLKGDCVGVLQYDTSDSRSRPVHHEGRDIECFDTDWEAPAVMPKHEEECKPFRATPEQLVEAYGMQPKAPSIPLAAVEPADSYGLYIQPVEWPFPAQA